MTAAHVVVIKHINSITYCCMHVNFHYITYNLEVRFENTVRYSSFYIVETCLSAIFVTKLNCLYSSDY